MKTVWNIVAVLAVANLLAIIGIVAYLRATDRLNMDRAREVRAMMSRTISQDTKDAEAKRLAEEQAKKQAEEDAKAARSPLTASETLAARAEATELDRQRMERLRREISDLQAALVRERAKLETDRGALRTAQQAFAAEQARIAQTTGTEQFERSLGVLASLKPAQARGVIEEIMRGRGTSPGGSGLAMNADGSVDVDASTMNPAAAQGGAEAAQAGAGAAQTGNDRGKRLAVEYLNAMDERARAKIMAEFAKDSPAVAAELLELLRMRGRIELEGDAALASTGRGG
jgi:hypothetical protein